MTQLLKTQIGNLQLRTCLYNASGPKCTSSEELLELENSKSSCILSKSSTLEYRQGNPEPRYWDHEFGSINSMGLPNKGYHYYLQFAEGKDLEKPYLISVNGLTLADTLKIVVEVCQSEKVQGMEINLSCPNIIGKGQLAYDLEEMDKYLAAVFEILEKQKNRNLSQIIGVKLPPYFDLHWYPQVTEVLKKYPIQFITCVNSVGNGLLVDLESQTTRIRPKDGMGGIGGKYIKPIGLSNVRNFYLEFQKQNLKIDVIGCGGVTNGLDALEYILCGASAVQIGTQLYQEGSEVFERMENEMIQWLNEKGIKGIMELKGKLKTI